MLPFLVAASFKRGDYLRSDDKISQELLCSI
jgi:hypothetical protein